MIMMVWYHLDRDKKMKNYSKKNYQESKRIKGSEKWDPITMIIQRLVKTQKYFEKNGLNSMLKIIKYY